MAFIALFSFLFFFFFKSPDRPTLTVSRTNVVIEAGSSAILSCGVSAVPTINSLYWTKDGVRLDPSQNPSKYNGGSISVPSLTLFNADVTSDPGSYTCVAANSIGTTFSDPVNLVVSCKSLVLCKSTVVNFFFVLFFFVTALGKCFCFEIAWCFFNFRYPWKR